MWVLYGRIINLLFWACKIALPEVICSMVFLRGDSYQACLSLKALYYFVYMWKITYHITYIVYIIYTIYNITNTYAHTHIFYMISLCNPGGFELLSFFCLSFSNNGDYKNFPSVLISQIQCSCFPFSLFCLFVCMRCACCVCTCQVSHAGGWRQHLM